MMSREQATTKTTAETTATIASKDAAMASAASDGLVFTAHEGET
jgi:hypothetical protein